MGAAVALIYAAEHPLGHRVIALNPAVSLSAVVCNSPLCRTIKDDYLSYGYRIAELQVAHREFEPVSYTTPATPVEKIFLGYGMYDQVTSPDLYRSIVDRWKLSNVQVYKCGHLNLLRVPRVANDIYAFGRGNG